MQIEDICTLFIWMAWFLFLDFPDPSNILEMHGAFVPAIRSYREVEQTNIKIGFC